MVNFQDPSVILKEVEAAQKLWYAVIGIYLWEYFTTLDFEWSIIRGYRPYRWTIWIYSVTRLATLMEVILGIIQLNVHTPFNCQLYTIFELIFSYFALASASLLLTLRVFVFWRKGLTGSTSTAIWKRNKIILALATAVWLTNVVFLIQGIVRIRSKWIPGEGCVMSNADIGGLKLNFIITFATDTILLLMMLAGLLNLRLQSGGTLSLGDFLWKQGVIWFSLAAVAEVPPTVFLILDLNPVLNIMFQFPALIVLAIAATRMYRSLINFSSDMADGVPSSGRSFPRAKGLSGVPPSGMHIAIHTTREDTSMSQTDQFNPRIEQLHVKAWGLGSEGGLETDVEEIASVVGAAV